MSVGHILKLKVSGLSKVFNDIKSLNPQKDEGDKDNINQLSAQEQ